MAKKYVAVALAVWMIWAAFAGLSASALPNHVVAGGVFGPGGSVAPGPTNAANVAGMVFYSTNQPSYTLLSGADSFTGADGTNPALFGKDVGAAWNWAGGDTVVTVVETIRGVSGWTGSNYTTSVDGVLAVGATVQDIGDGTLEAFPTLALTSAADWIDVGWSPLADANGNLVSYVLYHAAASGGPWTMVAAVNQGPTPAYNDTGLADGRHCYTLSVNYRRDQAGAVYETTGRSEPVCRTLVVSPWVVSTVPTNGAPNILLNAPIQATFSEAIDTAAFAWSTNPSVVLVTSWNGPQTTATGAHSVDFAPCTTYTVTITAARDMDANNLVPLPYSWSFTTFCANPYIVTTSPADLATQVRRTAPVVITFSKAMNTGSVVVDFVPTVANSGCLWSAGNTVCTITATTTFAGGTRYNVTVSAGTDTGGAPLVPGPVPNPWDFTTNTPPTAQLTAPGVGVCRTGGANLDISWTMGDAAGETAVGSLRVWLNYTDGVTTNPIAGVQGGTGFASPTTFAWTTPMIDADVQVLLTVMDAAGESDQDTSAAVTIDSTPPTALLTTPTPGATGVSLTAGIVVTFSEAMSRTVTEGAIAFSPQVTGLGFAWSSGDTVLTISHAALTPNTVYTITVGTGARDACTPGMALVADYTASFTSSPAPKVPNPPSDLRVGSYSTTAISISWTAPTQYTDGSNLPSAEISGYKVFRASSLTGAKTELTTATGTTYTDTSVVAGTRYYYWVATVATNGEESDFSNSATAQAVSPPPPGLDPLVILIPIIVILLIVGLFLLLRRKKLAAVPPKEAEKAPPEEEAPVEEAGEEAAPAQAEGEENREKFIPCPNCGTMVKPTDAECFVCGAKL